MTVDAVEQALRAHVRAATGPRAAFYRRLTGPEEFWTAADLAQLSFVEDANEAHECMRVSVRLAIMHGFQVVNGWAVSYEHPPTWHCWNRDPVTGRLADAAEARRSAIAYVGKVLTPTELDLLRRSADMPTGREMLEAAGDRLAGFGRALSALLG